MIIKHWEDNMVSNKIKLIFSSVFLLLLVGGCTGKVKSDNKKQQSSATTESRVDYSSTIQKYNGYDLGDYKYYVMNGQKKQSEFLETLLTDFDTTIKNNFETYQYKIDNKQKVNLIPFRFRINVNEETVTTNYFMVNNSNTVINEISFKGYPRFKNVEVEAKTEVEFNKTELAELPPKGIVVFSLNMSAPSEYQSKLKENKVADLSFDITDLEINGEKVDNNNEN